VNETLKKPEVVLFPEPLGPAKTTTSGFLRVSFTVSSLSGLADYLTGAVAVNHIDFPCFGIKFSNRLLEDLFLFQICCDSLSCILDDDAVIRQFIFYHRKVHLHKNRHTFSG